MRSASSTTVLRAASWHSQTTTNSSPLRRDRVAGGQDVLQAARKLHQDTIAGGVTERVVDELEAIEVQQEHRHIGAVAPASGKGKVEAIECQRAIRQSGQRIVQGGMPRGPLPAMALDGG
jgi:hypothetical protein